MTERITTTKEPELSHLLLDNLDFGLIACRELVPDIWDLAQYLAEALEELVKLADHAAPAEPAPS